ncbi:MAG: hypothetical protein FWE45_03505 [Firmicutes bacterium]|nr:hypothetical protein [Bacillota bacterium]
MVKMVSKSISMCKNSESKRDAFIATEMFKKKVSVVLKEIEPMTKEEEFEMRKELGKLSKEMCIFHSGNSSMHVQEGKTTKVDEDYCMLDSMTIRC